MTLVIVKLDLSQLLEVGVGDGKRKFLRTCRICKIPTLLTRLVDDCCINCRHKVRNKNMYCHACLQAADLQNNRCFECWLQEKPLYDFITCKDIQPIQRNCQYCGNIFITAGFRRKMCQPCTRRIANGPSQQCIVCYCWYILHRLWDGRCRYCYHLVSE